MLTTLTLALCLGLPPGAELPPNLDFSAGALTGWEGKGFYITTADGKGPSRSLAVCSSDQGPIGKLAMLHRSLVVPPRGALLHCTAAVILGEEPPSNYTLDVVVLAGGKRVVPKLMQSGVGWKPTPKILPKSQGRARDYLWDLSSYAGQTVRIVLGDDDNRSGCHLFCSGFRFADRDDFESKEFSRFMVGLEQKHGVHPMTRYDTAHFTALSNADEHYTEQRLRNCEHLYALFYDHFHRKGFTVREVGAKLMVALFDSQTGFEAYMGQKMSALVTGMYHPGTNRLVLYDYGQNESFVAQRKAAEKEVKRIPSQMDRLRNLDSIQRQAKDHRAGANIGTMMHEVAHHLSFNCGLLNRQGDVPVWLAEGLACYCESTKDGAWQGLGAPNPNRIRTLAGMGQAGAIPLRQLLVRMDASGDGQSVLLLYSQSWALFRMLIDEHPAALRKYLNLIYWRLTPDHRVRDFQEAFGPDLNAWDHRLGEYVKTLVKEHARPAK